MKKLVLTSVCALAVTGAALAQGTLSWTAFNPNAINAQTNAITYSSLFGGGATGIAGATQGGTAGGPTGFYYELLYNTTPFTGSTIAQPGTVGALTGSWLDSGLEATNTGTASRILPMAGTTSVAVSGWAGGIGTIGGTTNYIMLVGWSANMGTSWATVASLLNNWATQGSSVSGNAFFGMSTTGYIVPNTGNPGATVFNLTATGNGLPINSPNTQLYLLPVPEPTTLALAGLGGLSLLLFRRRK